MVHVSSLPTSIYDLPLGLWEASWQGKAKALSLVAYKIPFSTFSKFVSFFKLKEFVKISIGASKHFPAKIMVVTGLPSRVLLGNRRVIILYKDQIHILNWFPHHPFTAVPLTSSVSTGVFLPMVLVWGLGTIPFCSLMPSLILFSHIICCCRVKAIS